jgi:hypothetical protein
VLILLKTQRQSLGSGRVMSISRAPAVVEYVYWFTSAGGRAIPCHSAGAERLHYGVVVNVFLLCLIAYENEENLEGGGDSAYPVNS